MLKRVLETSGPGVILGILAAVIAAAIPALCTGAQPLEGRLVTGEPLPTGQSITPLAARGARFESLDPELPGRPAFRPGQAVALARSPDGRILLILTSGFNRNLGPTGRPTDGESDEYVFVYDIDGPVPRKLQVLHVPNSFSGIAWHPDNRRFYVSGGVDDRVHLFALTDKGFAADGPPILLGHRAGTTSGSRPMTAGLAVSRDGRLLLAANYQNDSISLIDLEARTVKQELDLRPGKLDPRQRGVPGGEYPYAIAWASSNKAYVASQRDRELVALGIAGDRLSVMRRVKLKGQPNALLLNRDASRLYVAADNSDSVVVIDPHNDEIEAEIPAAAPAALLPNPDALKGANPNSLALSPDERTLFVSLGGLNAVAVIQLSGQAPAAVASAVRSAKDDDDTERHDRGSERDSRVIGLIPTGWYPTAVAVRVDGSMLYIVNSKSNAGPNPGGCRDSFAIAPRSDALCKSRNKYVWQLEKAGFLTVPMPNAAELDRLRWQTATNNRFPTAVRRADMSPLWATIRRVVKHVIYVVKENRTYDQVLGDLEVGNGDPRLALLGERLSPNHHQLARQFVTLDNFLDSGETSNTGWNWSTAARATDFTEKMAPINYGGRGLQYDSEGLDRLVNVGLPTSAERKAANAATSDDPDILPGDADVAAPDGPGGAAGTGYLWDAAKRAGLRVRNYGFFGDFTLYAPDKPGSLPLLREPFKEGIRVFVATKQALADVSDPFYRGFDPRLPDFWRITEWERDFDRRIAEGTLPDLILVRLPGDHFGSFVDAIDGVDTVETQMADNDYALGRLVERVAHSPVKDSTLIFIAEDDAQNGADHVDAHRSLAYVIGPHVKQHAVVSERYTTVNLLRTIEVVLGMPPMGLNDALAEPMAAVFDLKQTEWTYEARRSTVLQRTKLPLPADVKRRATLGTSRCPLPTLRSAAYWAETMRGQDFSAEDRLDAGRFNEALWAGLSSKGGKPPNPDGRNLREDRRSLLAAWRATQGCSP